MSDYALLYENSIYDRSKGLAIHNELWWWFSFVNLIPANLLVLYSLRKRRTFNDAMYEEKFMEDSFNQEIKKKGPTDKISIMKTTLPDYYWKYYISSAFCYYFTDSIYCALNYELSNPDNICVLAMFLHHIATLFAIIPCLSVPHYPWFHTFPLAFHCFLIVFP